MIDIEKFETVGPEVSEPVKLKSSFAAGSQWETVSEPSNLETAYRTASESNPDEVGEVNRLSRQLEVSTDAVRSNLDTARNAASRPDLDEIKSKYPTLAGFAKDAWFMAMAKDDLGNLKNVESIFTTPMTEWDQVKERFDIGFKKVARNIASTVGGVADFIDDEIYSDTFSQKDPLKKLSAWSKKQLTENPNLEFIEPEKRPGIRGYQDAVVEMAPQVIYQMIAAANPAGAVTGTAFMGSQIFGSDYESLTEKGVDPTRAFYAALTDATLQAPLEQIGIGKALKVWKPGQTLSAAAKHILESVGTEFVTEWLQQYPQAATEIWAEAEKEGLTSSEQVSKFIEGFGKTTMEGLYQGLVAAPFGGLAGSLNISANEDFSRIRSEETKKKLDGLKEAIDSTLLKDREPETLQEFINRAAAANGEDGKVYLQADRIVEHAHNAGVDVAKWIEGYGVDKQTLVTALNTGGNVGLDLGKVAANLNTDGNLAALQDDMALKVDDTPASLLGEASEANKAAFVNIKELQEKEQARRLKPIELMSLEDQLVMAGMPKDIAKTNAAIYAARANTWAQHTGKTAAEWFKRWGLNVSREMIDLQGPKVKPWKPPVEEHTLEEIPLDAYMPGAAKTEGPQTLRGRIRQAGGINFLNFKGELKVMPTAVKFLSKKDGVPIDSMEQTLKEEGWLDQEESLLDIFRDKEVLKRGKVIGGEGMAMTEHQAKQNENFMSQAERDAEAPPEGTYAMVYAEDLPVGEKLTIIDGNGIDGWDVYEVIDKDPFGVTLKDGVTIELAPYDQVQVRVEMEGDNRLYRQAVATPSAMNEYNTQNPDSPVMFNGYQDLSVLNRPDLYYFTITDGAAKGHTFTVEDPTVENIAAGVEGKTYYQTIDFQGESDKEKPMTSKQGPGDITTNEQPQKPEGGNLLEFKKKTSDTDTDAGNKQILEHHADEDYYEIKDAKGEKTLVNKFVQRNFTGPPAPGPVPVDFRLSDGRSFAIDFSAGTVGEFIQNMTSAFDDFKAHPKYRQSRAYPTTAYLQIKWDGYNWITPGYGTGSPSEISVTRPFSEGKKLYWMSIQSWRKANEIGSFINDAAGAIADEVDKARAEEIKKIRGSFRIAVASEISPNPTSPPGKADTQHQNGRTYHQPLKSTADGGIKYIGIVPDFGSKYRDYVYQKYADIISLPEVGVEKGPLADLLTDIGWQEATPDDIRKFLEKRAESRRAGVAEKIQSVIADQIGDLIETFRYESHQEGLEYEAYIDSLLEATEEYLPRDRVQDRSAGAEAGKTKTSELSDDPRIALQKRSKAKQLRLFQRTKSGKAVFYSTIERCIQEAKQDSAPASQWAAMIKKMPVKSEELEWSGLNEWLSQQSGKVTKQQILDYLAANNVRVEEVEKTQGGSVGDVSENTFSIETEEGERIEASLEEQGSGYLRWVFNNGEESDTDFRDEGEAREWAQLSYGVYGWGFERAWDNDGYKSIGDTTKFSEYQMPGGENYRELLLTLPLNNELRLRGENEKSEGYYSAHWDEPNVLAHVRFSDRTGQNGEKILFIEEVQSDWHQTGRREGYQNGDPEITVREDANVWVVKYPDGKAVDVSKKETLSPDEAIKIATQRRNDHPNTAWHYQREGVPDAPFKKTWPLLAIKRMVRYAAENGYDMVAWTPGEVQADRYDLSKQVDEIKWQQTETEGYALDVYKGGAEVSTELGLAGVIQQNELERYLGKEIAEKIINGGKNGTLKGEALKVGGEGMKGFYDKILPAEVNKFFNKAAWGNAKVGTTEIQTKAPSRSWTVLDGNGEEVITMGQEQDAQQYLDELMDGLGSIESPSSGKQEVWSLPITPQMREKALSEGMPMFQGDKTRALIRFGEDGVDITLLKNANLSSFLHETGHLFLEDLRRTALEDNVMVEEWNAIKAWLQVEDETPTVDQHEAFARAFEAYLREGKAPSMELRSVFQQFKAWLRRIYRSILDLEIDLNDEVRTVFDKMLASENEIKEAEEFAAQLPMFDEMAAKKLGATDDEIREYLDITNRKTEGAIDEADKHKISGLSDRLKAWREQAEKESFEVRVYRAIYYLTRGVFPGAEGGRSGGGPGIAIESVRENFGQDVVDILPKIPGLLRKEGISFEHAAAQVGYENGTALLNDLKNMKPRQQWVEERIAALDVEYDAELDTAEAVRNALLRKQLEIESKWLARQAYKAKGPKLKGAINRRAARIWAEKVIDNEIVGDAVKVYNSVLTSQRLRKRAIERQRAGDWKGAFELNEKVRLNEELVLARGRAREKLVKIENKMKRFAAADPKAIQNDYRNQLYKLLQRFMFVRKQFAIDEDAESTQTFLKRFQANDEIDALSVPVFAEWLYDSTVSGYYKSALTWRQLQDVVDFASFLDGRGRELINKFLADQKTSIEDYANDAAAPTRKLKAKRVFTENSVIRKSSDLLRKYLASADMLMFVFRKMDGFSNIGKKGTAGPNEKMWQWLTRARDARDKIVERIDRDAKTHIKILMDGAKSTPKQYTHVPVPDIMSRKGMVWTYERIVSIALNMGNEGNVNRLIKGYGLSMEDLHDLVSVLTEDQLKAVQGLWDVIDTMYPEIDDVYYRINHFHMKKVEAYPLELAEQEERTIDGVKIPARPAMTLPGGYYPLKYDSQLSDKTAERAEKDDLLSSTGAIYQTPSTKSGATKARTGASMPPRLSLSVLSEHINDMAQYITHAEIIRDVDRITRNEVWKNEAERFLGQDAYRQVRPALKYAARPEKEWGGTLDTFIDRQRVKATTFILAWNFAVATKQVFSLPGVWTDIGIRNWMKGVGAIMAHPIEWKNTMHEVSTYMRGRSRNIDRDIMDAFKKMKGQKRFAGKTWDDITNTGFCLIKTMDFVAVYPSWVAAYKKAMAEHGNPDQAMQYADDTIRASQPSGQPIDLSAFQRDSRGWMKLFTMFSTFTMKYGNRQRYFYRAWREGKMKSREYAWHVALEAIAPPIMMNLVLGFLQGQEPPEPEELLRDALLYQFVGLPLVRDIAGFAWPSYPGQSAVDSPAFTGLELTGEVGADIIKFTKELLSDDVDEKTIDALIWDLAQLASFVSRIPASQIYKKAKKGLNQIDDGEGNVINLVLPDSTRRMNE